MLRPQKLSVGIVSFAGLFAIVLSFAAPAAAAPPPDGDWVITSPEYYRDQVITITNNSTMNGSVVIQATGDLRLENVTLILPFQSTFDVQGRAEVRNSTLQGERWALRVRGQAVFVGDALLNATYGGTVVETLNATFERTRWDCAGSSSGTIHLRTPTDFRNNTMRNGCLVVYELSPLATDTRIDFADNTFNDTGSGTQLTFPDALHTGRVVVDIHGLTVFGGGWSILVGATAPNTTFLIHDGAFTNTSLATIRVDFFEGQLRLWNLSFENVYRPARINGPVGGSPVATIDNITVRSSGDSIYAEDATWIIRNSTIAGSNPQYGTGPNGHIQIFDTADTAFASSASGANGSIEHFAFLNLTALAWQGGVPLAGDVVSFRNGAGLTSLSVDPSDWTPSYIVWWGLYAGSPNVDNRELHPYIADGARTFACAPSQFFVTIPMAATAVTCTDDSPPAVTVGRPRAPALQNTSDLIADGSASEYGSGIDTLDWSLDNVSWAPVTLTGGPSLAWSVRAAGLADGSYTLYFRAADRAGLVGYATSGAVRIDTTAPLIVLREVPPYASGAVLNITGTTEGLANLSFRTVAGERGASTAGADGSFSLAVPLREGLTTFWVTATDLAGNTYTLEASLQVDSVPPAIVVFLDATTYARSATALVEGLADPNATVRVNRQAADRSGAGFSSAVGLTPGLNTLTVTAADLAGNIAAWQGTVWYDIDPPALGARPLALNLTPDGIPLTRSTSVALTGSALDNLSGVLSFSINGVPYPVGGDGSIYATVTVVDGLNTLRLVATDRAGNSAVLDLDVLRDNSPPAVTANLTAGDGDLSLVGGRYFTSGSTVVVAVWVSEEGVLTLKGVEHAVSAGLNEITLSLAEGSNVLSVACRDRAGNLAVPFSLGVVRDTAAPTLTLSTPDPNGALDADVLQVAGTTEPGATLTVNGQPVAVSASGSFSTTIALPAGTTTIRVTTADLLGNTNSTAVTVTRRAPPVSTGEAPSGGAVGMFMVGLGAGLAAGVLLARKGRRENAGGEAEAGDGGAETAPALNRQRKGPRGPQARP